jgi:hypothetical protein
MRETAMMAGARSIFIFRHCGRRDEIRDVAVGLELEGVGEGIEIAVEEEIAKISYCACLLRYNRVSRGSAIYRKG